MRAVELASKTLIRLKNKPADADLPLRRIPQKP
jgi:hypothetical protein